MHVVRLPICHINTKKQGCLQEQVQRGRHLHLLLGARQGDLDGLQGGQGDVEERQQGKGAEQVLEMEEPLNTLAIQKNYIHIKGFCLPKCLKN